MSALLAALLAAVLTSIGSRDQLLVAHLAARLGKGYGLLATSLTVTAASTALAAWAGSTVSAMLPAAAKQMLVAMALVLAAIELAWPRRKSLAAEPTRSLGAIAIVLAAQQITDAARFLVFALAAAFASPTLAAVGGTLGSGAMLVLAWAAHDQLAKWPIAPIRLGLAAILLVVGVVMGLSARGLV
jgi:putative Ca2+/H+ antiporter (TMEM165/GDT1 family)